MSKTKSQLFDVRSIERNIKLGLITRADVAKYQESLADVANKGIRLGEIEDQRAAQTGEVVAGDAD